MSTLDFTALLAVLVSFAWRSAGRWGWGTVRLLLWMGRRAPDSPGSDPWR